MPRWSCDLRLNVNQPDTLAARPDSPDPTPTTVKAEDAKQDPVGEFLDHLRAELRQLDPRCCQLEILLHDLTIRLASTGPDEPRRPPQRPRRAAAKPREAT